MIQFNLLPDVKLEYIKARRLKRSVMFISTLIAGGALGILILLYVGVAVFQKEHLNDLSADIATNSKKLNSIKDLNKILTIQNQLNSLSDLHDKKLTTSRLFPYMQQVTPADVSVASLNVDFTSQKIIITGSAKSLTTVNQFVDTLKFTTFSVAGDDTQLPAFSQVVLSSFGRDDKGASYTINLKFDATIFEGTKEVKLKVPSKVTSRSETEKPDALFQPLSDTKANQ